jgi:agmatinase
MPQRKYIHFYEGPVTFYRAPAVPIEDLPAGSCAVLGVPIDQIVVGDNGQKYAPRAIRESSLYLAGYFGIQTTPGYIDLATGEVTTIPDTPRLFDVGDVRPFEYDVQVQTAAIADAVAAIVRRQSMPVLLGGDHYVPYPAMLGFIKALRDRLGQDPKIGYLHIDSHSDFWDEFQGMGRYNHGTCVRRISELSEVKHVVLFGLNAPVVEPEQFDAMLALEVKAFTVASIRRQGVAAAMAKALALATDGVDYLYVSCDIDVLDGFEAPGTHSIVTGGLHAPEYFEALRLVSDNPLLSAFDICEVVPRLDVGGGRTSRLAAMGVLTVLGKRVVDRSRPYDTMRMAEVFL